MLRFIGVITFAFVFASCSNNSTNSLAVFNATEEGLQRSNEAIAASSNTIYHALDDRLTNPRTAMHANIWQPKAMIIKQKSSEVINYIEALVKELKKEAGLKTENFKPVFKEDNLDAASRLFIDKNKGKELYEKLKNYKKEMLAVDPEINNQFGKNSPILTKDFEYEDDKQKEFANTFFNNTPTIAALAMLRKFENNVKIMENQYVEFCLNKIANNGEGFTFIRSLIGQSSNTVKGGDKIEITAGIGAFSVGAQSKVTINGKLFQPNSIEGVAKYNFKTPLKPGKYSIPVKIEYTAEDGTRKVITKKVDYTVVE